MFTWVENEGGRGPDEVLSSLYTFILETDLKGEKLIAWSDSCGGQNKNFFTINFWQYLLLSGRFKEIYHKFPVLGHTYMDCDQDFGLVEKEQRRHQSVYLPTHYRDIIRDAKHRNKYIVFEMAHNLYKFKELPCHFGLVHRKKNEKENFAIQKVSILRFREFGWISYKNSFQNSTWKSVDILHKRKIPSPSDVTDMIASLRKQQDFSHEISAKKLADVYWQMPYIPGQFHWFYQRLVEGTDCQEDAED